jgi:hypothetical protein
MRVAHLPGYTCLALLIWSCRPVTPVYTPYFDPGPAASYQYSVSEMTRTVSTEAGKKVGRDQNIFLSFLCRNTGGAQTPQALHIRLDAFALHGHADGQSEQNLDAATAPESPDPTFRMFGAYQGAAMDCRLNNQGQVLALPGFDDIYQRMGQGSGEWKRRFDQEFFARLFEKGWHIFPDRPISVGESWNGVDSLNADPHIPLVTRYTLVKVWAGAFYIQTDAPVDVDGVNLKGTDHGGQLSLKGRQRGLLRVDVTTGLVLDGQTRLEAEGVLETGPDHITLFVDSTCSVNGTRV